MIRKSLAIVLIIGVACLAGVAVFLFGDRESLLQTVNSPDQKTVLSISRVQKSQWGSEPDQIKIAIRSRRWFTKVVRIIPYDSFLEDFKATWDNQNRATVFYSTDDASLQAKSLPGTDQKIGNVQIRFIHTAAWVSSVDREVSMSLISPDSVHQAIVKVNSGTEAGSLSTLRVWLSSGHGDNSGLPIFDEKMCKSAFPYGVRWSSPTSLDLYIPACMSMPAKTTIVSQVVGDATVRIHPSNGSL